MVTAELHTLHSCKKADGTATEDENGDKYKAMLSTEIKCGTGHTTCVFKNQT